MTLANLILAGIFFFLCGACVGSFLNVVIWRLPHRGHRVTYLKTSGPLTLSWPPSHCPMCDSPIPLYRNIPVLSYVLLRARCANCRRAIPIRYPLVELGTAILWGGMYLAYFIAQCQAVHGIRDLPVDWAPFVVHLLFASALLAASAIDADIFVIPLPIPIFLGILGVVASVIIGPPLLAARPPSGQTYGIVPALAPWAWWLAKPVLGAVVGVVLANVLLALKLLPRSFDAMAIPGDSGKSADKESTDDNVAPLAPPPRLTRIRLALSAVAVLLAAAGGLWIWSTPPIAAIGTICAGILVFLIGVLPRDAGQLDVTDEVIDEISSPHVRREILKEALFLAVPLACAAIAYALPLQLPQWPWLARVLGALLGALAGGGVVWLIRVGGSLAFNKEAMGMGDAHLMAGVGAVLGAPLVVVAFFAAPFLGILWAIVLKIMGKPNVLPYGPWLSVASILALLLGHSIIAFYMTLLSPP